MFEIEEADYQTTCCCCFKTRVARGGRAHESGLSKKNIIAYFMGLHEIKKKHIFNELEHEPVHCMHEKLDLWYLSEFFLFFEM